MKFVYALGAVAVALVGVATAAHASSTKVYFDARYMAEIVRTGCQVPAQTEFARGTCSSKMSVDDAVRSFANDMITAFAMDDSCQGITVIGGNGTYVNLNVIDAGDWYLQPQMDLVDGEIMGWETEKASWLLLTRHSPNYQGYGTAKKVAHAVCNIVNHNGATID
jgi:hypothetical protein